MTRSCSTASSWWECGPSCPSGGTHETRERDFTRIMFHDGRWTRWRRDGVRFEYEPLPLANSRGTYRWALRRVIDTHSNTVFYEHSCDDGECYLNSIAYGNGRDEAAGGRKFASTTASGSTRSAMVRGASCGHVEDLEDDRGADGGRAGARLRARLRAEQDKRQLAAPLVQTFPSDATVDVSGTVTAGETKPQPPTVFTTSSMSDVPGGWGWRQLLALLVDASLPSDHPGNPSYSPVFNGVGIDNATHEQHPHGQVTGDFYGDARLDVARWAFPDGGCGDIRVTAVLAHSPSVQRTSANGSVDHSTLSRCALSVWTANVNGDSADDLLFMGNNGRLRVATSGGDGRFWFADAQTQSGFVLSLGGNILRSPAWCSVGEFDGDGRSDLACVYQDRSGAMMLGTARARQDGGFNINSTSLSAHGISARPDELRLTLGDVNADGESDLVVADPCDSDEKQPRARHGSSRLSTSQRPVR